MSPSPVGSRLRSDHLILVGLVTGVVLRVVMLVARLGDAVPFSDTLWYSTQAEALRRGRGFNDVFTGEPTAEHGPLTPILLSPATGPDGQRALMALIGIVGFCMLVTLAVVLLPPVGARAAVWIAALYPNLWMHETVHMSEAIAIALVTGTMLSLWALRGRPSWTRCLVVGVVAGLAGLARSELALLVPLGAFAVWRLVPTRRAASAGLVIIAGLAAVGPWAMFNLQRFEEPTSLTTNDGTTLLGANCDETYYGGNTGSWSFFCVADADGEAADASVRSVRQRSLAFDYVDNHTKRLPFVLVARVARSLDLYGLSDMVAGDAGEDKFRWVAWLGIASFWVLAPLAVVGAVALPRRDRLLLAPVVVVVAVTTVVFYGAHRIRAPMEPAVVLAAASGVSVVVERVRRRAQSGGRDVPVAST